MKKFLLILFIALDILLSAVIAKAQFQENIRRSLFSDQKAFGVGDAVTILIVEETQADNSATTNQSSATDLSANATVNTGSSSITPSFGVGTGNTFRGNGQTTRKENLRAKLSARVISMEPSGLMKIEGKRTTKVNGETQTITITGTIRPTDIQTDNSVFSYNISDLTLYYEGEGTVTKAQESGMITKFLRMLF